MNVRDPKMVCEPLVEKYCSSVTESILIKWLNYSHVLNVVRNCWSFSEMSSRELAKTLTRRFLICSELVADLD